VKVLRRHPHECARPVAAERRLEPLDRLDLTVAQPVGDERWHAGEARAQRRSRLEPVVQRFRPVEGEDPARTVQRIDAIREQDLGPRRLIIEAERRAPGGQYLLRLRLIAPRLLGHARQGSARRLGLDHAARLARDDQEIVAGAGRQGEFAHRDAEGGETVQVGAILHHPARRRELPVDDRAGPCFWGAVHAAVLPERAGFGNAVRRRQQGCGLTGRTPRCRARACRFAGRVARP
jgi:hypothetical protein